MSTKRARNVQRGSVGAKQIKNPSPQMRGRDICLYRMFGEKEFTLYLTAEEAEDVADALDELLDSIGA